MARFEHFAIYADDTTALAEFHMSLFGLAIARKGAGDPPGYFLADEAGGAIEIIGRPAGSPPVNQRWVCHLAYWSDDVAAAEKQVRALGIDIEPETRVDNDELKTFFFLDPAGNRIQVVWRREPLAAGG